MTTHHGSRRLHLEQRQGYVSVHLLLDTFQGGNDKVLGDFYKHGLLEHIGPK
jgi:hypothetical protein